VNVSYYARPTSATSTSTSRRQSRYDGVTCSPRKMELASSAEAQVAIQLRKHALDSLSTRRPSACRGHVRGRPTSEQEVGRRQEANRAEENATKPTLHGDQIDGKQQARRTDGRQHGRNPKRGTKGMTSFHPCNVGFVAARLER
jgi:hypothetical protein